MRSAPKASDRMRFYLILFTLCFIVAANSRPRGCGLLGQTPAGSTPSSPSDPAAGGAPPGAPPAGFPSLEYRKWSGDINVPDPVAVSLDPQGRVYATQTRRRKIQDLDIRANRQWIADDVGLQTVQQKRDFLKSKLAIGGDDQQQAQHVEDVNQDGHHDWRDLTVISEVIYRLVDRDDDGTADEMTTFAEDFKTEVTGIAAGVLAFEDAVYATIAPDLWKLRDHDDDGVADSRESIAHGFGLHIAYAGHDMHGPTVGPDGKIYWSIGDKGIHVTTADGQTFAYPNQGGVLRCNPDGSDFEVFAHGLRNVQEVAFDQYGNLFGVDNDSDQPRERERFVYIVDGMDAGWRCHYQYRGNAYNPWTAERLWELPGKQHAAYIIPPLDYSIDGPAGFKFNPGTALAPAYRDFFFLTGAPNGNQIAFRIVTDGDAFKKVDEHAIGAGMAIVGLAFGPDGGLYGADWDGGYPMDEKGSVVCIDVAGGREQAERLEVKRLLGEGLENRGPSELLALLDHADQRVRLAAQFALVAADAGDLLASRAVDANAGTLARLHAVWGLGQLQRQPDRYLSGGTMARDCIGMLLKDKHPIIRAQAAKTYGELKGVDGYALVDLLDDDDLHVRTLAGLALSRHPSPLAVDPLWAQTDVLQPTQHYVRHGLVSALASCASSEQLAAQAEHANELRRLCAVLALRKQRSPLIEKYLHDSSDWVATAAARAIHDDESIAAALPQLAAALSERSGHSEAFCVRAINANFRSGDADSAQRILSYAADPQRPIELRLTALQALAEWLAPPVLDRVEGYRRELAVAQRQVDAARLAPGLAELAAAPEGELRAAALRAARHLRLDFPAETLQALVLDAENAPSTRGEALQSLAQLSASTADLSDTFYEACRVAVEADQAQLQIQGLELLGRHFPQQAVQRITDILQAPADLSVQQAAIAALPRLPDQVGLPLLQELVAQLAAGELDSRWELELREAAAADDRVTLPAELAGDKFAGTRDGGDRQRGKELFNTHVAAQCSRCHRIGEEGSDIGPPLTTIAALRDADYLQRAILEPNADIDAKYRVQMFLLDNGQVLTGVVNSRSDAQVVLSDSSGRQHTLAADAIEEEAQQNTSLMPDMREVLTPREVRDLVAYLRSLK